MVKPAIPSGDLVYAVGDIHGQADLLQRLLDKITTDASDIVEAERRWLVFVGDYVDRGPDSWRVIEMLSSQLPDGFEPVMLKGNHEDYLLKFLEDPGILPLWRRNGAEATLNSYDGTFEDLFASHTPPAEIAARFAQKLPPAHLAFFQDLKLSWSIGDYFFVHAGVRPGCALELQALDDLLWIREPFLNSDERFEKIVVHGHTPTKAPVVRPNRIGIDTGAWAWGTLTAVRLFADQRKFLTS